MSSDELEKRIRELEDAALERRQVTNWERIRAIRVALLGRPDILDLHREIVKAEQGLGDIARLPELRKEAREKFEAFLAEFDAANPVQGPHQRPKG